MMTDDINEIDSRLNDFCVAMGMVDIAEEAPEQNWLESLAECCQEEIDYIPMAFLVE